MAKLTPEKTAGMYYLQDVKETASGFKLDADGSFRFFFTYGAIDRYGSGRWTLEGDQVVLQSKPWSGKDFALVNSQAVNENAITLRMTGANPILQRHVYFSLQNGAPGTWQQTNERGVARFTLQQVSTITLVFEFCPERFTHFVIDNPEHNFFEFRFEQWIMEVFFDQYKLKATRYAMTGGHPLIRGEKFVYERG